MLARMTSDAEWEMECQNKPLLIWNPPPIPPFLCGVLLPLPKDKREGILLQYRWIQTTGERSGAPQQKLAVHVRVDVVCWVGGSQQPGNSRLGMHTMCKKWSLKKMERLCNMHFDTSMQQMYPN